MKTPESDVAKVIVLGETIAVRQAIDNMGWMCLDEGVLVVDALEQAHLAEEVMRQIAETTGDVPVRWVLNTHTHYDHVALNPVFHERFGAEIISCPKTHIPSEGLWFGHGERRVQMIPMPGCHTKEDCIVWVPGDSVLFVGDIFGWGLIPWDRPLDAEKLTEIIATYERLIAFGADTVVPGHGPLCSTEELRRWVSYVRETTDAVKLLHAAGVGRREMTEDRVAPPTDMHEWWRFLQWKHEDTVGKIAQAVSRGRL